MYSHCPVQVPSYTYNFRVNICPSCQPKNTYTVLSPEARTAPDMCEEINKYLTLIENERNIQLL